MQNRVEAIDTGRARNVTLLVDESYVLKAIGFAW